MCANTCSPRCGSAVIRKVTPMFFKPTLALTSHFGTPYDLYSDWHKEAFGCRPGRAQSERYDAMSDAERQVEHATIEAWSIEEDRINALSHEVNRFRFSRRMEYLMRREGVSEREAFKSAVVTFMGWRDGVPTYTFEEACADWDYVCYCIGLPYSDAAVLRAKWEELKGS